jgi:hypothetical protein
VITNLFPEHIHEVLADLSDQTQAELAANGWGEEELLPRFLRFMMSATMAQGYAFLDDRDEVLAVLAVAEHEGVATTFLVAATGFFEHSVKNARAYRQFMAWMGKKFGAVYTYSKSPHPEVGRWMKLLGAVEYPSAGKNEKVYRWG